MRNIVSVGRLVGSDFLAGRNWLTVYPGYIKGPKLATGGILRAPSTNETTNA